MGCSNTKLHAQQIAYQRDFLGACWNSTLGEEESEEYLASRWMGVSKSVMALYTNNHCFTVRTLNTDEKARTDTAAAGKAPLKPADDPTGLATGFGGDLGGGGGRVQSPSVSMMAAGSPALSLSGKPAKSVGSGAATSYALFPESGERRDFPLSAVRPCSPPPTTLYRQPTTMATTSTTTAQRTTVRQNTAHAHPVGNNSVASAAHEEHDGTMATTSFAGSARAAVAEKKKKGADPAALRNVVKDSIESERVLHADHPYLQRHGLSVYGGVVFRCAPAHRLYHRISLVPEANVKRLYDLQVTAMSRSVLFDASVSMLGRSMGPENPNGGSGGGRGEVGGAGYHHFQPGGSSRDNPRLLLHSSGEAREEERGVPPMTPPRPSSSGASMVPSPMLRPLNMPPSTAGAAAAAGGGVDVHLGGREPGPLPSFPLAAVAARHLRFTTAPGQQQSAVIDAWATQSPLSAFNNYPADDRDVAGVTAQRPPVIIGSVTAMELQALPPNAELCLGGWLYVSLQDEQERLRKSLKRYVARQRRRAAKRAAAAVTRISTATSTSSRQQQPQREDVDASGDYSESGEGLRRSRDPSFLPKKSKDALNCTTAFARSQPGSPLRTGGADDGTPSAFHSRSLPPPPRLSLTQVDPMSASLNLKPTPARTPSQLRPRSSSVPLSPMFGPAKPSTAAAAAAATATVVTPPPAPLRHTGRYAREVMEADTLNATWLPYAYVVVAVPMYECGLVPTTFHTAFTRHKAVSLNIENAQSRQAYGVGCITGVRYGGVMIIEYRDKVNDEEDADWIGELLRVGRAVRKGGAGGGGGEESEQDEDDAWLSGGANTDLSASAVFHHLHHSASRRARAEKLRRVKSRIWHKLRKQGLHVVLAATRMADRRHRQQRASVANEVNHMFSSSYADAAAATMGASSTPQHFAASVHRGNGVSTAAAATTTTAAPNEPAASTPVARAARGDGQRRSSVAASDAEAAREENAGLDEGGVGGDYGGAEELNEAMADAVEDFDSTNSNSSRSSSSSSSSSSSHGARNSLHGRARPSSAGHRGTDGGASVGGADSLWGDAQSKRKKARSSWWRTSSSSSKRHGHGHRPHHHHSSRGDGGTLDGRGETDTAVAHDSGHHHHHHHHHHNRHGRTTREDRLRWADPQMADDFYLRGTFRQIGGMKYLDVVSLMDGCPVSELVQGIKRWVLNLLSMPIKARPICLFLQRYEGIAASLRVMQTQLTATALAMNVASGKQLAQTNLSFNMPVGGMPGMEGNMGMDEVAASAAMQGPLDPTMDFVSPAALVNASFAALQAPAAPPTRTVAYHTYYCGPLEPVVRAVLSPEIEAMIAACRARQPRGLSPATADTRSSSATDNPLSAPQRGTGEAGKRSATTTNGTPTPLTNAAPHPSPTILSPHVGPSPPAVTNSSLPHCVKVPSHLSPKQQQQQQPAAVHGSPLVHPQATPTAAALPTPHGSFAAAGKSGGAAEGSSRANPPLKTVPTTITECLFYDDPTKREGVGGNSFTAANGEALAAAAAALVLAENAKGHGAVTNGSFVAPSANPSSFHATRGPSDTALVDARAAVSGISLEHTMGPTEHLAPGRRSNNNSNNNNNMDDGESSVMTLSECGVKPDTQTREAAAAAAAVTVASTAKMSALPSTPQAQHDGGGRAMSPDTSTGTFNKREVPAAKTGLPNGHPPLLLPAAHACNLSQASDDENDDSFHDDAAEERELEWQLADREARALRSELDDMTHLVTTAREELLERLEELIQLGALFLPHTRPDQVALSLITMKMLRQYPEEVPVKEIHTDWLPLLMTLLTTSRETLLCAAGYDGGDLARVVSGARGFLSTYNNVVDAGEMCDANKRRLACDAGVTKYMIDPLPPLPAPRRLHDIVIAPQPVRFTKTLLHDMQRVGMDSEGLSFAFSGGSLGVLAGVIYYYSDFLRAKYKSEVAAAGGRARDAGATVLDVLSRGGYNVLLRRIWIWGVTPEPKSTAGQQAAAATRKLLNKTRSFGGDDATSDNSSPSTPIPHDEREYVTLNTAGVGTGFVRVVGKPFKGTEAYALFDAVVHYLRTLEELCSEHHGNASIAPQAPVKRRSVLMAWRRNKDADPITDRKGGGVGGETQSNNGPDNNGDDASGARDMISNFEVCVASNYYYKRMLAESHGPARSRAGERRVSRDGEPTSPAGPPRRISAAPMEKGKTKAKPPPAATAPHKQKGFVVHGIETSGSAHDGPSILEQPYCGGEEAVKKDALQRKTTKKFYGFLSDHYEQWRARHSEDRVTTSYGKRISVSLN